MSLNTSLVAEQYRLQEWAAQIKECQNRPAGMPVKDWCKQHGITKTNYYYRLRRVRKACLENLTADTPSSSIVPVPKEIQFPAQPVSEKNSLDIVLNDCTIHVSETTSAELLARVLQVISHVK